jgi:hypothetical protein
MAITRLLLILSWSSWCALAWTTSIGIRTTPQRSFATRLQTATTASDLQDTSNEEDEEEEYEYIELDQLTEAEFVGSEWLVGTCFESSKNKIKETWLRLAVAPDGKNLAVWGDGAQGKWSIDVASGFFSASKETLWRGKEIWACTADDYYFMQGTVRGWTFLTAANVVGQWQARRLGVDPEEAGVAPWLQEEEEPSSEEEPALTAAAVATEEVKTDELSDTPAVEAAATSETSIQQTAEDSGEKTDELSDNAAVETAATAEQPSEQKKESSGGDTYLDSL